MAFTNFSILVAETLFPTLAFSLLPLLIIFFFDLAILITYFDTTNIMPRLIHLHIDKPVLTGPRMKLWL